MQVSLSTLSSVIPAAASVLYISFAVFGLQQRKKVGFNWSFQFYVLMLALWSFGSFMMRMPIGIGTPLMWNRIMLVGMLTGPFVLVRAVIDTLGLSSDVIKRISRISFVLVISLMYVNFAGMVVKQAGITDEGVFFYQLGSGAMKAYLTSYAYLALMVLLIIIELRKPHYDDRTRILFYVYLLGMVIMLVGILLNLVEEVGRYPVDILASMINALILFYGIYRYKLVNYTRYGLYTLSMALLLVLTSFLYYILMLMFSNIVPTFQPSSKLLLAFIMGFVTVIVVYPMRLVAALVIDRIIIPRRHPYQQRIRTLSQKLTTIIDLDTLGSELITALTTGTPLSWAICLVRNPHGEDEDQCRCMLLSQSGYDGPRNVGDHINLNPDENLLQRLEELKQGQGGSAVIITEHDEDSLHISDELPDANIIMPLVFHGRINGYICMHAPRDSRLFSQYELEALEILSGQCALSVNNALSFERMRQQKEELAVSHTKLEAIFNGIGSPLALTDIDFTILEVNAAAVTFIGRRREEIIGEKCYRLFFHCAKACSFCRAPEALRSSHIIEGNAEIEDRIYSLQFHPVKIVHNSRQVFLEIIQDETEELKMQEELQVSAKMAEIGSLAAGIAHDLNNPLAGIMGTAELLLEQTDKDTQQFEFLEDILQYSRNATDVIREISLYARRNEREPEETSVTDELEFSLKLAARGMDMTQVAVERDYHKVPSVMIPKSELQQVYLNIIMNAIQALDGKGTLKLCVDESYGVIHVSITDSGKGIPKDQLSQVFTPFFTTKEPGEGTGLGLSNCFRIVTKNKGRISLDSTIGKGTTLSLFFPAIGTSSEQIRFVLAEMQHHFNDVFYIQRKVLIGEKGYIEETIHREEDDRAYHLLAYRGVEPVGTVSLLIGKKGESLPIKRYFDIDQYIKHPDYCAEIIRLAVIPEMRNTLVALGLVSLIFLYGRSMGMKEVVIDVFSQDVKNIEMYRKFGFEEIGTYRSPSSVTVMIQRDATPHEQDATKRSRFVAPLFRRLYNMFDFGLQHQAVTNEMRKIIPKIGIESYDKEA